MNLSSDSLDKARVATPHNILQPALVLPNNKIYIRIFRDQTRGKGGYGTK